MTLSHATGLGIDAGGSCTRWLLVDHQGHTLAQGETKPISGHMFSPQDAPQTLACFRTMLKVAQEVAPVKALVAGITGLHADTEAARLLQGVAYEVLGLSTPAITITNDIHIAYASAFHPGEGALIYAGTGSVGYHLQADGNALRVGGYGLMIDDAGAGYWIGHQALKQVFRWFDETGVPATTPLATYVYAQLGTSNWERILEIVYPQGRGAVASLTPAVALAFAEGDTTAAAILEQAGKELGGLANTLLGRIGQPLPVALIGGIARITPVMQAFRQTVPANIPMTKARTSPVEAAARLALGLTASTD